MRNEPVKVKVEGEKMDQRTLIRSEGLDHIAGEQPRMTQGHNALLDLEVKSILILDSLGSH